MCSTELQPFDNIVAEHDADQAPAPSPLQVATTSPRPGTVLVRIVGEIDLTTAPRCRRMLCQARREATAGGSGEPGTGLVICDLSGVSFLSAAGLRVLDETDALARRDGASLRLVAPTRPACRVLALTGMDRRIPTGRRLGDALPERREPAR